MEKGSPHLHLGSPLLSLWGPVTAGVGKALLGSKGTRLWRGLAGEGQEHSITQIQPCGNSQRLSYSHLGTTVNLRALRNHFPGRCILGSKEAQVTPISSDRELLWIYTGQLPTMERNLITSGIT